MPLANGQEERVVQLERMRRVEDRARSLDSRIAVVEQRLQSAQYTRIGKRLAERVVSLELHVVRRPMPNLKLKAVIGGVRHVRQNARVQQVRIGEEGEVRIGN